MNEQLDAFVKELNAAWQRQDWQAVRGCYHKDVVLLPPDAGVPITGVEAVVASYQEFADAAELLRFEVSALEIFDFEEIHMAHMAFTLDYVLGTERTRDSGLEIYTISTSGPPQIVWRSQIILDHRLLD